MKIIIITICICVSLAGLDLLTSYAADFTSIIPKLSFNKIPSGTFYMGSSIITPKEKQKFDLHNKKRVFMGLSPLPYPPAISGEYTNNALVREEPQHKVSITNDFLMGTHEVTLGQFKFFVQDAKRYDLLTVDFLQHNNQGNTMPVVWVSWNDVQDFIAWLNKLEDGHYRLPTEAEWEYSIRAGTISNYFWGNNINQAKKYAWFDEKSTNICAVMTDLHPVGLKLSNKWGLYDMSGNAAEWIQDMYSKNYYKNSTGVDPQSKNGEMYGKSGSCRVVRGGGIGYPYNTLRSSFRFYRVPTVQCNSVGFRLCRDMN